MKATIFTAAVSPRRGERRRMPLGITQCGRVAARPERTEQLGHFSKFRWGQNGWRSCRPTGVASRSNGVDGLRSRGGGGARASGAGSEFGKVGRPPSPPFATLNFPSRSPRLKEDSLVNTLSRLTTGCCTFRSAVRTSCDWPSWERQVDLLLRTASSKQSQHATLPPTHS